MRIQKNLHTDLDYYRFRASGSKESIYMESKNRIEEDCGGCHGTAFFNA